MEGLWDRLRRLWRELQHNPVVRLQWYVRILVVVVLLNVVLFVAVWQGWI